MSVIRAIAAELPAAWASACTTFGVVFALIFLHYFLAGGLS